MNQEEKALRMAFHQLEKSYRPFIDFLVENQNNYPEFKGAVTIDGFLVHKPKLLILLIIREAGNIMNIRKTEHI